RIGTCPDDEGRYGGRGGEWSLDRSCIECAPTTFGHGWTMVRERLEPQVASRFGCDDVWMRILLVEDDRRLSELLARRLRTEGHDAETCDNGVDGLERATFGDFDLAILDVMLPGLDGISLTSALRGRGSSLPV